MDLGAALSTIHSKFLEKCEHDRKHIQEQIRTIEKKIQGIPESKGTFHERLDLLRRRDALQNSLQEVQKKSLEITRETQEIIKTKQSYVSKNATESPVSQMVQPVITRKFNRTRTMKKRVNVCSNIQSKHTYTVLLDELREKYLEESPPVYVVVGNQCDDCGDNMRKNTEKAVMVCSSCGLTREYIEGSNKALSYSDKEVEYSHFSYRRSNHLAEVLNAFQGKEATKIADEVYQTIMEKLHTEYRISDPRLITNTMIRAILKHMRNGRKFYEHVNLIRTTLSGEKPPRLTPQEETTLKLLFERANTSFERLCPSTRKNFLSYHYTIYKLMQLIHLDQYLPFFNLLKCREKLWRQDLIWKSICEDNNWQYIPSI